ncbi:MAG: transglutaminase, partial [Sandarakinorhabdus sp.]|nr:transglutaminase [Sandarakinorhabdus sp.]
GTQTLDWERNDDGSIDLALPGGGFFPPDKRERPADQDQDAPWEIEFPRYSCDATSIRLPPPKPGTRWRFNSKPMNRVVEGRRVYRATGMVGDVARLIRVSRTLVPEISAAEARATNAAIAGFDNNKAVVLMARRHDGPVQSGSTLPFADGADWTAANSPCQPPGT